MNKEKEAYSNTLKLKLDAKQRKLIEILKNSAIPKKK